MDAYRVAVAREGREAADKRFSPVGAGLMVERIGERVEGDEWRIHAFALLVRHDLWKHMTKEQRDAARNARFSLIVFIDVATKVIVGLHLYHAAETNSAIKAIKPHWSGQNIDISTITIAARTGLLRVESTLL